MPQFSVATSSASYKTRKQHFIDHETRIFPVTFPRIYYIILLFLNFLTVLRQRALKRYVGLNKKDWYFIFRILYRLNKPRLLTIKHNLIEKGYATDFIFGAYKSAAIVFRVVCILVRLFNTFDIIDICVLCITWFN